MAFVTRALAAPFKLYNAVRDEVAKERRLTLQDGAGWTRFSGRESNAGKTVTQFNAYQVAAVWACIKVTAQAVSSLPMSVYEVGRDGSRSEVFDDLSDLLTESPNRDQTPLEFWEGITAWLLTNGNAYAEKMSIGSRLASLDPIPSSHCMPRRKADGELVYVVRDRGKNYELPRDKIFHVKGFGQAIHNADMGMSPIAAGTNSIGAAMAAQEAAAATFASGLRPTGFFLFDQQLSEQQRTQAEKSLVQPLSGSSKAGGVGILEAGVKWQSVSLNPEDAQMLLTRRFDIEELCRWFGTPPIVIGHAPDGQTMWGSGVEQILISWLTLGIDPICDRIEARVKKDLIRPSGNRRRYAEFNREALLQMDSKAKAQFLSQMVQNGLMDRNEGRDKLNLPRREGADALTVQTNLSPLDQLGSEAGGNQARQAMLSWLGLDRKEESDDET
ncbi:phage portal protein [Roseovarius pacificus]|uniref:phage portal protein n=1 Tax=Roseovarius pacificus TaxID=337701 RepID=UPI002A187C04|nr:phage portal protein [Roseovarius pacificus]